MASAVVPKVVAAERVARGGVVMEPPPFVLDGPIRQTYEALDGAARLINEMMPVVVALWDSLVPELRSWTTRPMEERTRKESVQLRRDLEGTVKITERLGRLTAYGSKVLDEAVRLRAFLAGGPSDRKELDVMFAVEEHGADQLVELLVAMLATLGLCPGCQEKVQRGVSGALGK